MINLETTIVLLVGQSNMADPLRQKINEVVALGTKGRVRCYGNKYGGASMAARVGGSPGSYVRSSNYNTEIAMWNAPKADKIVVVWFQGESDAETTDATNQLTGRLDAWYGFITEDLLKTGGLIKTVYCLPWRTDTMNGFGIGGNGDTVRSILVARAAAEGANAVTYETNTVALNATRYDNVHINITGERTIAGPAIGALALGLI